MLLFLDEIDNKRTDKQWRQTIEFSRQSIIMHCELTNEILAKQEKELINCGLLKED